MVAVSIFAFFQRFFLYLEYSSEYGDCWPVEYSKKFVILANYTRLVERLEMDDDFIFTIKSRDCLTAAQLCSIENCTDLQERKRAVLDMIMRSSVSKFNQFIECLSCSQPHIVPLLTGNKGKLLFLRKENHGVLV